MISTARILVITTISVTDGRSLRAIETRVSGFTLIDQSLCRLHCLSGIKHSVRIKPRQNKDLGGIKEYFMEEKQKFYLL